MRSTLPVGMSLQEMVNFLENGVLRPTIRSPTMEVEDMNSSLTAKLTLSFQKIFPLSILELAEG